MTLTEIQRVIEQFRVAMGNDPYNAFSAYMSGIALGAISALPENQQKSFIEPMQTVIDRAEKNK